MLLELKPKKTKYYDYCNVSYIYTYTHVNVHGYVANISHLSSHYYVHTHACDYSGKIFSINNIIRASALALPSILKYIVPIIQNLFDVGTGICNPKALM